MRGKRRRIKERPPAMRKDGRDEATADGGMRREAPVIRKQAGNESPPVQPMVFMVQERRALARLSCLRISVCLGPSRRPCGRRPGRVLACGHRIWPVWEMCLNRRSYFTFSTKRMRMAATWARVAPWPGSKLCCSSPWIRPEPQAQAMACWAQPSTWPASP